MPNLMCCVSWFGVIIITKLFIFWLLDDLKLLCKPLAPSAPCLSASHSLLTQNIFLHPCKLIDSMVDPDWDIMNRVITSNYAVLLCDWDWCACTGDWNWCAPAMCGIWTLIRLLYFKQLVVTIETIAIVLR